VRRREWRMRDFPVVRRVDSVSRRGGFGSCRLLRGVMGWLSSVEVLLLWMGLRVRVGEVSIQEKRTSASSISATALLLLLDLHSPTEEEESPVKDYPLPR